MAYRLILIFLMSLVMVCRVSAEDQIRQNEITSLIGEVIVANGSIKADPKARKELEAVIKRLAKLPKQTMVEIEGSFPVKNKVEIEGVYPDTNNEEYINKSFFLAMETEGYIRDTLGVKHDFYLSARSRNELKAVKPLIRIVLHSGTFVKQPVGEISGATQPVYSVPVTSTAAPTTPVRPQVTPVIGLEQNMGGYQVAEPVVDSGPIDERLVAEQAKRAQLLIEETKAKAAERDRKRKLEESVVDPNRTVKEKAQPK